MYDFVDIDPNALLAFVEVVLLYSGEQAKRRPTQTSIKYLSGCELGVVKLRIKFTRESIGRGILPEDKVSLACWQKGPT